MFTSLDNYEFIIRSFKYLYLQTRWDRACQIDIAHLVLVAQEGDFGEDGDAVQITEGVCDREEIGLGGGEDGQDHRSEIDRMCSWISKICVDISKLGLICKKSIGYALVTIKVGFFRVYGGEKNEKT